MATNPNTRNTISLEQSKLMLEFARRCAEQCNIDIGTFRSILEHRDRIYQRSLYVTAEQVNRARSSTLGQKRARLGQMDVPIAMPQVESATAYQAGVFCSSYPIFGVVAEQNAQAQGIALQFETVLGQQATRYGWARELIKTFRDGFKYNAGFAAVLWHKENLQKFGTSTDPQTAGMAKLEQYSYGGNKITRLDPYNCFMDMRVGPTETATKAEFFGCNELMSRITLKRFLTSLDPTLTKNFDSAYRSEYAGGNQANSAMDYYIPQVNPYWQLSDPRSQGTNWIKWAGLDAAQESARVNYRENYVVTHFFCRACPSDFGGSGNIPQVYYCIIVNWKYVVYAERIVSAHDFLPVFGMQPNEDGLRYQTQSMLDISETFQEMGSDLWNITLEGKRREIFDRLIYNPKMIDKKDIDPASSVARIPVRNSQLDMKQGIAAAIYQIPYRSENSMAGVQLASEVSRLADEAAGQNKVTRGQFQKGNKTRAEFETVNDNSNARQQLTALTLEHSFFTPVKEVIKANTLQYQSAGKILNQDRKQIVSVDPVELRQAMLEFTVTDGMLPMDKIMAPEVLQVFLQTAQAIPSIQTEYDVLGMFTWWMRAQGARWVEDFKRNPEQQQEFLSVARKTLENTNPGVVGQQIAGQQAMQQAAMQAQPAGGDMTAVG